MVSVYGAHLQVQAAEDTYDRSARAAPPVTPSGARPLFRPEIVTLLDAKRQFRDQATARRAAAHRTGADAGRRLCDKFVEAFAAELERTPAPPISGYWPMGDELDILPLLTRLSEDGRVCALPVVVARGEPLIFRRWRPGETLVAAGFGTHEPEPEAPEIAPDIVLTPLLAFDDAGRRLGYGGGYYDRTLRSLRRTRRIVAVGIGFDAQRVARVPAGGGDETLDWIVTEERAIRVE